MNMIIKKNKLASSYLLCGQCREDREYYTLNIIMPKFCSSAPPLCV